MYSNEYNMSAEVSMSEIEGTYQIINPAIAKNYSLTLMHIAKVRDLAQRMKVSQGEIMRNAIDHYFLYESNRLEVAAIEAEINDNGHDEQMQDEG